MITLTLGRGGMGSNATEADFDAWSAYVSEHIDEACGFNVAVEERGARDVQDDAVSGGDEDERAAVEAAKQALWDRWCAEGGAGIGTVWAVELWADGHFSVVEGGLGKEQARELAKRMARDGASVRIAEYTQDEGASSISHEDVTA